VKIIPIVPIVVHNKIVHGVLEVDSVWMQDVMVVLHCAILVTLVMVVYVVHGLVTVIVTKVPRVHHKG